MKTMVRVIFFIGLFILSAGTSAQIGLGKKILDKTKNHIEQKTDQAIDKGIDDADKEITGSGKEEEKKSTGTEKQETVQPSEPKPEQVKTETAPQEQTALQTYSKYDFIPGEKVIFYEDFSQDAVGDFPALWNTNGSAEVVTTNLFPGNWMKFDGWECIWTDALIDLPDNYTLEFDVIPVKDKEGHEPGFMIRLMQAKNVKAWDAGTAPGKGGFQFHTDYGRPFYSTWLYGTECEQLKIDGYKDDPTYRQKVDQKYHMAIWVQKSRLRLYQNENKVFDLPKAFPTGCVKPDRIRFERGSFMVTNIRVAVGAPDTRNKLLTEGKLVTYGIYFDVNKDIVKPESNGTLKEIATVLTENPDVRIKIIGHTDSDGADAANLDLSKRRAASVKNELSKNYGIDASRMETDGKGETEPVAPNDTPANKALNRRVEFVKL